MRITARSGIGVSVFLFVLSLFLIVVGVLLTISIIFIFFGIPVLIIGILLLIISIFSFFGSIFTGMSSLLRKDNAGGGSNTQISKNKGIQSKRKVKGKVVDVTEEDGVFKAR